MIRRRLATLATAASIVLGMTALNAPWVAAAGPPGHGVVCSYVTATVNWPAPPTLHGTTAGVHGQVCTDYKKVWTTPGYPNNCFASIPGFPGLTDVNGVCGYSGNQTSTFYYVAKFTMSNISGILISLGLPGEILSLPSGTKRDCTAEWAFTPSSVANSYSVVAWTSGTCGGLYTY